MTTPPGTRPNRRSTRLRGFDYASNAGYVVTICTYNRRHLFGRIVDGEMQPSWLGTIVEREWRRTAEMRPGVTLDGFCLMPNHVHGIIILNLPDDRPQGQVGRFMTPSESLSAIVRGVKSAVTATVKRDRPGLGSVWQRGFHDRVIRNHAELEAFQRYLANNAAQWELDRYYSQVATGG